MQESHPFRVVYSIYNLIIFSPHQRPFLLVKFVVHTVIYVLQEFCNLQASKRRDRGAHTRHSLALAEYECAGHHDKGGGAARSRGIYLL